jgi:hypothetical protein
MAKTSSTEIYQKFRRQSYEELRAFQSRKPEEKSGETQERLNPIEHKDIVKEIIAWSQNEATIQSEEAEINEELYEGPRRAIKTVLDSLDPHLVSQKVASKIEQLKEERKSELNTITKLLDREKARVENPENKHTEAYSQNKKDSAEKGWVLV